MNQAAAIGLAWVALLLVPAAATVAYALRNSPGPIIMRLRPHFVLGFAALGFTLAHVWIASPTMRRADLPGIWLATIAWVVMFVQIGLGVRLRSGGQRTLAWRRVHTAIFWSLLVLISGHVLLNARTLHPLKSAAPDPRSGHRQPATLAPRRGFAAVGLHRA